METKSERPSGLRNLVLYFLFFCISGFTWFQSSCMDTTVLHEAPEILISNVSTAAPPRTPTSNISNSRKDPHHSTSSLWSLHQPTAGSSYCSSPKPPDLSILWLVIWARAQWNCTCSTAGAERATQKLGELKGGPQSNLRQIICTAAKHMELKGLYKPVVGIINPCHLILNSLCSVFSSGLF